MRNKEKIRKQNSLLWNHHKMGWRFVGWMAVIGLIYALGASFSTVVGIYLGYKVLRLALRLFGLITAAVFTLISMGIMIMILIISLFLF